MSYLKSAPSNFSICKISGKNKNAYIWDQKRLIWVIFGWNLKTILKSAPSKLSDCKISRKNKNAWIWDQKCLIWVFLTKNCLIWVFFGKNFKNTIVIFEISTLKFACLQNFTEKQKCLNLWPKKSGLGIFVLELENNIVIF